MRPRYWQAAAALALGLASILWSIFGGGSLAGLGLLVGAAAAPAAVLLFLAGRLDRPIPINAAIGGGTIGVAIALVGHGLVIAFAYFFFLGFADAAVSVLEAFRLDPELTAIIDSPWVVLAFFAMVLVAPFVEEFGKAIGARLAKIQDRRGAFLAGVAGGVGFAVVENVLYATGWGFFGDGWEEIVVARMLGAAVHALASGLVVMGWWEWKESGDFGRLLNRFLSGVGVHAFWNGSLVALMIVGEAYGDTRYPLVTLAYAAAMGAVAAGVLWRLAASVDRGAGQATLDSRDGKLVALWTVLAASVVVPVALLVLAFPL